MNQLQDKYESKGLSIIGVTSESQSSTEPWVSKHGARYAYGYNSGSLKGKFPGGIPMAILVDPSGNIVWKGHPSSLKDGDIEKALAGALETPMWEWPASAKSVRSSLKKRHSHERARLVWPPRCLRSLSGSRTWAIRLGGSGTRLPAPTLLYSWVSSGRRVPSS